MAASLHEEYLLTDDRSLYDLRRVSMEQQYQYGTAANAQCHIQQIEQLTGKCGRVLEQIPDLAQQPENAYHQSNHARAVQPPVTRVIDPQLTSVLCHKKFALSHENAGP